jgi:protein-tyrosine phosphatase
MPQDPSLQVINIVDDEIAYAVTYSPDDVSKLQQWAASPEGSTFALIDLEDPTVAISGLCDPAEERAVHELFVRATQFFPFHLDYGPFTWTEAYRLIQGMRKVRAVAQSHNRGDSPITAVLLLRCFGDLESFTNLVTSLMVGAVQIGALPTVDHIRKLFPYTEVLSRTIIFHDASPHDDVESVFDLTVEDVVRGALRAVGLWGEAVLCDEASFIEPSEQFLKLNHGDLSWIVPGETAAFSCPVSDQDYALHQQQGPSPPREGPSRIGLPAEYYASLFSSSMETSFFGGIGAVVQLNEERYNEAKLVERGIDHIPMIYDDGSIPSSETVDKFLDLVASVRQRQKGIAVHCMAGLGRTGSLLCIDLMVNFGFGAKEAIGWCRLMRPGSVIGHQQQFLLWYENALKRMKHKPSSQAHAVATQEDLDSAVAATSTIMKRKAAAQEAAHEAPPVERRPSVQPTDQGIVSQRAQTLLDLVPPSRSASPASQQGAASMFLAGLGADAPPPTTRSKRSPDYYSLRAPISAANSRSNSAADQQQPRREKSVSLPPYESLISPSHYEYTVGEAPPPTFPPAARPPLPRTSTVQPQGTPQRTPRRVAVSLDDC